MAKHGKKYRNAHKQVSPGVIVLVDQALASVKSLAYAKFDESVDVSVNLGIDASRGDHVVRGSVTLPHGRGKVVRVVVFAKGDLADQALKAGADFVGVESLVEKINSGWLDFDYAIATPDLMGVVGQLAKLLGPRGLLPNKKVGTVTLDPAAVVRDLKSGRVFFKNDKNGIVHFSFGRKSFEVGALRENLVEFMKALVAAKPASSKGKFLKKVTIASTMGVGIVLSPEDIVKA